MDAYEEMNQALKGDCPNDADMLTDERINDLWDFAVKTSEPTGAQLRFKFFRAIEAELRKAQAEKITELEREVSAWVRRADKTWHETVSAETIAELTRQLGLLAGGISEAAIAAGICRPDADITGPLALMLCQDLATNTENLEQQLAEAKRPTQFWDNDDAERCHSSIDELLNREWCNGVLEAGAVFTIQQAHRLPNILIEVTSISEDGDVEYREIDAAIKAKDQP